MKPYPSIPRSTGQKFEEFEAYVFDKLDGRNVRVEYSKKQGWHKFGSRHRLFDKTDLAFAPAIPLFEETLSEKLTKLAVDNRWERAIVFMEFWGPTTVAGLANPDGTYNGTTLSVIDVDVYKKGLMDPRDFLKLIYPAKIPAPHFCGIFKWSRGFVESIRNDLDFCRHYSVTYEGVVGKRKDGHLSKMSKAKTQKWIDDIIALRGEEEGRKIVES